MFHHRMCGGDGSGAVATVGMLMPRIQNHHPDKKNYQSWTYEINGDMHILLTKMQKWKPTENQLYLLRNFIFSLMHIYLEWSKKLSKMEG